MNLIDQAFHKAQDVLRYCCTDKGFTACSLEHDDDPHSNYRSVWARDSAITFLLTLGLNDKEFLECGRRSMDTLLARQTRAGHIPNYVMMDDGTAEFGGIGNIAGIDGPMWMIYAIGRYTAMTGDTAFASKHYKTLRFALRWLRGLDANNCGLIEVPESSDWMDLFPRSYNVLYDEVLWFGANREMARMAQRVDDPTNGEGDMPGPRWAARAVRIKEIINYQFWPTTETIRDSVQSFSETQYNVGRARFLISQITPFGFSFRCDVYANILAFLMGVLDHKRAHSAYQFLRQIAIDEPHPIRILYPVIRPGEPDWKDYFLVHFLNLPYHYHNGGIWPFVGGMWVQFLLRAGERAHAERALLSLAECCRAGLDDEWEFNEWCHGQTGRPMGKAYQAWSAAAYIAAYLDLQGGAFDPWAQDER